jgi:myo-inositol-1(or 4)-monophosphatase
VDGVLEAGVVLQVPRNETFSAWRGSGPWMDEQRIKVPTIGDPEFALIGTGFPVREVSTSGIRRPGAAALDLADVAAGRFDGFWEQHLSAWDTAAGSLLIREAGGRVTDFTGRDVGIEHRGVVAGNPAIHDWLLAALGDDQ